MINRNSILLRRRNKVIVPRGDGSLPPSYTATINKNLEGLGYTLSKNVFEALVALSSDDATCFYEELVAILTEARGVRDYKPMYPNFPRQVMEAPAAELYLNAVLHYLTAWVADVVGEGRGEFIWLPGYEKQPREPLKDSIRLTVIELGTEDDLHRIFSSVISSKASISETDREELKWYFQNYKPALPESIPNKEVLAFVGALIPDSPALKKHIKTATDVLRLTVAMSGGYLKWDLGFAEARVKQIDAWSRLFLLFAIALMALTALGMKLLVRGGAQTQGLLRRVASRRRNRCELSLIAAVIALV